MSGAIEFAAAAHPQHTSQLEELRRKAAEPVHVPVKFSYEDTRGIRDRGESQGGEHSRAKRAEPGTRVLATLA